MVLFSIIKVRSTGAVLFYQKQLAYTLAQQPNIHLKGLAYQVMQTQGASQSISISHGCLDSSWLLTLAKGLNTQLLNHWKYLVSQNELSFEIDHLEDVLMRRCPIAWVNHLREESLYLHKDSQADIRSYHLEEVKEVTNLMIGSEKIPLSSVLERKEGTLRFGHALRLLGRANNGALRDIIDNLDTVRTGDQLIRTLAIAVQECVVAGAKSEFIIIPNDQDLIYLLDDIEKFGASTLAGLLIILSSLRYPLHTPVEVNNAALTSSQTEERSNNDGPIDDL